MSETKHAPLPWSQYAGGDTIYGGDGYFIAVVQSTNGKVDTAFIVEAVNSFEANKAEIARLREENDKLQSRTNPNHVILI